MGRLQRFYPKQIAAKELKRVIKSIESDKDSAVNIVDHPSDGEVGGRDLLEGQDLNFPARPLQSDPNGADSAETRILRTSEIGQELTQLTTERETSKIKQKDTQHGMWSESYSDDNRFEDADLKLGESENDDTDPLNDPVYAPYTDGIGALNPRYEDADRNTRNITLHSTKYDEEATNGKRKSRRTGNQDVLWVCVDLDNTILSAPEEYQDQSGQQLFGEVLPGNGGGPGPREALQELIDGGARVSIYTARQSFEDDEDKFRFEVEQALLERDIPYSDVYIGLKPGCDLFVDDKSVPPFEGDWELVLDTVRDKLNKKANDPIKDTVDYQGIKIDVEWPSGSIRSYEGEDSYVTHMKADYGFARGTMGNDGEELDIYLVDRESDSEIAYVIEQVDGEGNFDEEKVMLGFNSEEEAADMYLQHMPSFMLGEIREVPVEKLRDALYGEPEDRCGEEDIVPSEEKTAGFRFMAGKEEKLSKQYPDIADYIVDASSKIDVKYLEWFAKELNKSDDKSIFSKLIDYIAEFKKYINLLENDLYKYSIDELVAAVSNIKRYEADIEQNIDTYKNNDEEWFNKQDKIFQKLLKKEIRSTKQEKERGREKLRGTEEDAISSSDIIYEDEDYLIALPGTTQASCYFGSNTRWCISGTENSAFPNYSARGNYIYIIINKNSKGNDPMGKIAVVFNKDKRLTDIFDRNDTPIGSEQLDINILKLIEDDLLLRDNNKAIDLLINLSAEEYDVKNLDGEQLAFLVKNNKNVSQQAVTDLTQQRPSLYFKYDINEIYPEMEQQAASNLIQQNPSEFFLNKLDEKYPEMGRQSAADLTKNTPTAYFEWGLDEKYPELGQQAAASLVQIVPEGSEAFFHYKLIEAHPELAQQAAHILAQQDPNAFYQYKLNEIYPELIPETDKTSRIKRVAQSYGDLAMRAIEQANINDLTKILSKHIDIDLDYANMIDQLTRVMLTSPELKNEIEKLVGPLEKRPGVPEDLETFTTTEVEEALGPSGTQTVQRNAKGTQGVWPEDDLFEDEFTDGTEDRESREINRDPATEKMKYGNAGKSSLEKFLEKHNIKREGCGLGFSEKEQKWYGWSHRAMYGFSIGDKVKENDVTAEYLSVGFEAKTLEDAKKMATAFADGVS